MILLIICDKISQLSQEGKENIMKTNKSLLKRLKVTKNGKLIGRKPGIRHFNAKTSRSKQLAGKRGQEFVMTGKEKSRFLPGLL